MSFAGYFPVCILLSALTAFFLQTCPTVFWLDEEKIVFLERGPKSYFLNHLADSARRHLKLKLESIKWRKKRYDMPVKSYSDIK